MESSEECVYLRREKDEATETTVLQKPLRYLSACRTLIDKSAPRGGFAIGQERELVIYMWRWQLYISYCSTPENFLPLGISNPFQPRAASDGSLLVLSHSLLLAARGGGSLP